jgi:glycosyltransferase involved in cell wall biosynthesis
MVHPMKQRQSCRIADVGVAISEQTKRDLIEYLQVPEEKIKVIYQSCDPMFWKPVSDSDRAYVRETYNLPEKYIICVGSIEERKNQVNVVRALAQLPDDVHLVIVGKNHGGYQSAVQSAIRSQGLTDRVHILKDADFEDFPALYACAYASVYMSLFEGFGIPILESMCCDTPVVTSNVSSMPEAGGDAALYASPDNPDEVAQQLMRIIEDPNLRADLVAKGRVQREKFSQKKVIGDLYNLYTTLVPQDEDDF